MGWNTRLGTYMMLASKMRASCEGGNGNGEGNGIIHRAEAQTSMMLFLFTVYDNFPCIETDLLVNKPY